MGGALYESFEELIFLTEQNEKHFHLQNEISVGSFYPHHGKIGEHIQLKKDGPFKKPFDFTSVSDDPFMSPSMGKSVIFMLFKLTTSVGEGVVSLEARLALQWLLLICCVDTSPS